MPNSKAKNPVNWEDYEHGRSSSVGSEGSLGSRVQFDAPSPTATSGRFNIPQRDGGDRESDGGYLRHRRSSISMRINSLAQVGGVNSLENFARSWSRAAGFAEIPPRKPSFVIEERSDDDLERSRRSDTQPSSGESRSLLRQQLEREGTSSEAVIDGEATPHQEDEEAAPQLREVARSTPDEDGDILDRAPYLASPFASSYGGVYGSLSSQANDSSMRHAGELYHEQQIKGRQEPDKEQEPLLVQVIERKDGKRVQIVVGQSTLPQTVFNSVNVLIGVGLLSLPLGLKYSGWLVGMIFLLLAAITTRYTAGVLAKCLDVNTSLIGFADIAYQAFGERARVATAFLFTIELLATCVALVVLFADSLNALIPGWGLIEWKLLCGLILIPLSFVPLRYLSITSVLGIICCIGIVILIFVDGALKTHSPGSLRDPALTSLFPQRWSSLPLSFGLLMAPWGGHSVFPNIYRDMRHPLKYTRAINYTYVFTYLLDALVAVVGFLMFGQKVLDELTSNILMTKGYPNVISVCIVVFIAIIPLTKIPLNLRPIHDIIEKLVGMDPQEMPQASGLLGLSGYTRGFLKFAIRIFTVAIIILIAILVPSFDTIMALMGSAMAFSICIVLPLAFHLKLFGKELGGKEKAAADSFNTEKYELEAQGSIADVFHAVQDSSATFGVVPFENSSNGPVVFTLDLLIDRAEDFPEIHVCGEAYMDVQHCLLGRVPTNPPHGDRDTLSPHSSGCATPTRTKPNPREPRSKPLTSLKHVQRVYSHPQAFGQCEAFLSTYLKGVERREVSSTSRAASIVAKGSEEEDLPSGAAAAISSALAADVHGLTIMATDIQDVEDNTTRFLIIQKGPVNLEYQGPLPPKLFAETGTKTKRKALIAFSINHGTQGALANALLVFKNHGLNVTSINSRPSRIRPWHYIFLVEVEGKKVLEDPDLVRMALDELDTTTEGNKWLGCWVDRSKR
ncbi:MAG: hypothetical protein ASARMPRED_007844 [Alectoria sarmentosa]|nr:MAG: hypothetical protein ASARMPRED_007844 [Alectoria sarmentosa]